MSSGWKTAVSSMREPIAVLDAVSRAYDGPDVVTDVTVEIASGARIALVGPSGSGKTTLLHLIAGLDEPTAGRIAWPALGVRTALRPTKVAVVFQGPTLLAPLTAEENVTFPLLVSDAADADAHALLITLGLGELGDRLPEQLSTGQAQRVAMARALVTSPQLLIADEPTGQLDHDTAIPFIEIVLSRIAGDAAVIVATHDERVAALLDERWTMRDGRVTRP